MPRRRKPVVVYEGKPPKGRPYEDGMAEFVESDPPGVHDYQIGQEEWPGQADIDSKKARANGISSKNQ